jgi:hypothetical protein
MPDDYRRSNALLERLAILAAMDASAVFSSADSALYCRCSMPVWERRRAKGDVPPVIMITARTFGHRKLELDKYLDARTKTLPRKPEKTAAALTITDASGGKKKAAA